MTVAAEAGSIHISSASAANDEIGGILPHYVTHITKHLSAEQEQLYIYVAEARTKRIGAGAGLQGP